MTEPPVAARLMSAIALLALAGPAGAGFYNPSRLATPLVGPNGPRPLPWELFRDQMSEILRIGDPVQPSKERLAAIERRDALLAKGRTATADELAELGLLHWRLREPEKAMDTLIRARAADPRNFWALANLAAVFQAMGQLHEAESHWQAAMASFPSPWPGTAAEGAWYRTAEKAQAALIRARLREIGPRTSGRAPPPADVDGVFPVRFIGPTGEYEAGRIADEERAKLPPDAVSQVQQLLLWFPEDTRLLWLLGELYNAAGDVRAAEQVFDECVGSRRFESPALRDRRRLVKAAAAALTPPATPTESFLPESGKLWLVGGLIGVIILAFVVLQVRELRRRLSPGPPR